MRKKSFVLRTVAATAALAFAGFGLAGCGAAKGGATTCGDYMKMSSSDQKDVIKAFFSEKGKDDPAGAEVILSQQSAKLYCSTIGSASDPIKNIDG